METMSATTKSKILMTIPKIDKWDHKSVQSWKAGQAKSSMIVPPYFEVWVYLCGRAGSIWRVRENAEITILQLRCALSPWPPNLDIPLRLQQQVDHRLPLPPCHSCTTELGSERTMIVWKSQKVPLFVCLAFAWNRRFFIDDGPCELEKGKNPTRFLVSSRIVFRKCTPYLDVPRKLRCYDKPDIGVASHRSFLGGMWVSFFCFARENHVGLKIDRLFGGSTDTL